MRTAPSPPFRALCVFLAAAFGAGALRHAALASRVMPPDESPTWRHLVFAIINLFFAWGFAARSRHLLWPAAILLLQQTQSHGSDLVHAWRQGRTDYSSLGVLLLMPVAVYAAGRLARAK